MRTITLEEHFVTAAFLKATHADATSAPPQLLKLRNQLLDLGEARIAAMDEGGVDLQLLSLAALGMDKLNATDASAVLHDSNDELAAAVRAHPTRLAGFAALDLNDPAAAAEELERCVTKLGFKGALLNGTTNGKFLDQPEFLPVFEAASALGVPIYLHPAPPPKAIFDVYFAGLPGETGHLLSIAGWGWHAETGLHTLRLIVSGLFDRFPALQLVIGHMGEGLPYALARSSKVLSSAPGKLKHSVADYFRSNIHITTSGYFTVPPFQCAMDVVGIDRLMFSVDYPFSPNTNGRDFLNALPLGEDDMAKFTHTNAEAVFRL
jgi:predicted TIM-barrel fold metal-dependent hydrolase